jgi:hypothetical protein
MVGGRRGEPAEEGQRGEDKGRARAWMQVDGDANRRRVRRVHHRQQLSSSLHPATTLNLN